MAKTRIERNLPNNAYQAAVGANAPSSINTYATMNDILPNGNILISGGASYSGTGMTFDVSVLVYLIEGLEYTSAATSVTLANGDPSNPRFDAIVADGNLVVSVIQGIAAADPITPSIGSDQVLVQYVLVGAGATSPNITTEFIYQDDGTTHWTGATSGNNTSASFTSATPPPFQGAACTLAEIGQYGSRRGVNFHTGTPVDRSEYVVLSFRVNFPADLVAAGITYFRLWAYSEFPTPTTGEFIGWAELGNFCDLSLADTWQVVNIPTALFSQNLSVNEIGYLNWTCYKLQSPIDTNINPPAQVALDDIKLQTGFGPQLNIATIDVFNEGNVVGATSKLDFRSSPGFFTRTSTDPTSGTIKISPNSTKTEVTAFVGAGTPWVIDAASTTVASITDQAASPLSIPNPTGIAGDGQKLVVKIKDNGFAVTISWGAAWKEFTGVTLPSSSGSGKWIYVTAYYDVVSANWHVIDVKQEI